VVDALEAALTSVPGVLLLHRTSDPDHNRSVITVAGPGSALLEGALRAAAVAAERIDLNRHRGEHPRLGALDVLPFVPLEDTTMAECVDLAHEAGQRIWEELRIPVYFYEAAALRPERARLENVRRGQFEGLRETALSDPSKQPDIGGLALHSTAGAVIVGARKFLVAYNINLRSGDLEVAQAIARGIRESNGGFPAVKALGLPLESRGLVQVSMNLTDLDRTRLAAVYAEVERLAAARGVAIEESELIGLMPRKALDGATAESLKLKDFDAQRVIENRVETALLERSL
jgi:glutamate formiminotransferase/glutamate formiminotransferase/formiminotetrahydrofolate cyclodeaminase